MKFTVKKTIIVDALSSALGVVEKRQAIPILSNVLIHVEEGGGISLTATDTESEIKHLNSTL
jgi:DNA polymerase sliding clamp subunit (PCNA homolog)